MRASSPAAVDPGAAVAGLLSGKVSLGLILDDPPYQSVDRTGDLMRRVLRADPRLLNLDIVDLAATTAFAIEAILAAALAVSTMPHPVATED